MTRVSLKSNREVITENRKELYYTKYRYKATFNLIGARMTTYCGYNEFLVSSTRISHLDGVVNNKKINNFYNFRKKYEGIVGKRIEKNQVCIYFNELDEVMLQELDQIGLIQIYKASVVPKTIVFSKPTKFKHRIYLKQGFYEYDKRKELYDFISRYCVNDANLSKPLTNMTLFDKGSRYYAYFHSGYKIDFNEESVLTLFKLIVPNFFGKHFLLVSEADKDKYSNTTEFLDGKNN